MKNGNCHANGDTIIPSAMSASTVMRLSCLMVWLALGSIAASIAVQCRAGTLHPTCAPFLLLMALAILVAAIGLGCAGWRAWQARSLEILTVGLRHGPSVFPFCHPVRTSAPPVVAAASASQCAGSDGHGHCGRHDGGAGGVLVSTAPGDRTIGHVLPRPCERSTRCRDDGRACGTVGGQHRLSFAPKSTGCEVLFWGKATAHF